MVFYIINILTTHSPTSCHFPPLRPKIMPQQLTLGLCSFLNVWNYFITIENKKKKISFLVFLFNTFRQQRKARYSNNNQPTDDSCIELHCILVSFNPQINLLATDMDNQISTHYLCEMWIFLLNTKKITLWNTWHIVERQRKKGDCAERLKNSVSIFFG